MRKLIIAGLATVLMMSPSLAQKAPAPDPATGSRSTLLPDQQTPTNPKQELMRQFMDFTLPYVDYQIIHYKNETTGDELGTAKRMGFVITFRDPEGNLIGTAKRKTQMATAYYDADGNWLGDRIYQLQSAVKRNVIVRPGDAARQRPTDSQ